LRRPFSNPTAGARPLVERLDIVIVDAVEHVGGPRLRIDLVEARRPDQRVHHGGALAAAVGAGEQPGLAAERDAASARSAALLVRHRCGRRRGSA
jgi:hypothetical protein